MARSGLWAQFLSNLTIKFDISQLPRPCDDCFLRPATVCSFVTLQSILCIMLFE